MDFNRKKALIILAAAALVLAAGFSYKMQMQKGRITAEYANLLPEEYTFKVKVGEYVETGEIDFREDMKTTIVRKLNLAPQKLEEGQLFYIKLKIRDVTPNETLLGLEYSNLVFSYVRPADNTKYPLLFTYESPDADGKAVKRYLLSDAETELELVGVVNEITVIRNTPRSIQDSIHITLFNTTLDTENPLEVLDYRILVCSKWGC